jgi:nitroreductase/NAD-dependent dihydropyrimidine dehydrogenase PreA subunit
MGLLTIDRERCKQDGLCAADCPFGIIRFDGKGSYPELVPNGETMCVRCGHCVAVCPHGALDHADVPLAECPSVDPVLAISKAQAEQFLRSRRSVRQFADKPVDAETLQRLIEIARYAPTGSNGQPLEWLVINDKTRLGELAGQVVDWMKGVLKDPKAKIMPYLPMLVKAWDAGIDSILRSAPCLVTAMAPATARNGMVELSLALSYLELAAPLSGLGTCWAGLLQAAMLSNPALKQAVGVPAQMPHFYPMMIGYAKVRYHRLPQRKAPKITWG